MKKEIPDILTLASKEKFRRGLLISSRVIGVLLILAIFWVGFIQIKYVQEVNEIRAEYGSLGYCYMCGLETGRSCECNYVPMIEASNQNFDKEAWLENIAFANTVICENRNDKSNYNLDDLKMEFIE
jgi:hypothetical protein